jgi:hypothetical protein
MFKYATLKILQTRCEYNAIAWSMDLMGPFSARTMTTMQNLFCSIMVRMLRCVLGNDKAVIINCD